MDFLIRAAMLDDYDGLNEVFNEADELHIEAAPHIFQHTEGPPRTREHLRELLDLENEALFVAEGGGEIVGLVYIKVMDSPDFALMTPRRFAHLDSIAVKRSWQGRGVGRALVEAAHRWARENGATQVDLMVYEFNEHARAFYESLGYVTLSRKLWRSLKDEIAPNGTDKDERSSTT